MKVLFLYNNDNVLDFVEWLRAQGNIVDLCSNKLIGDTDELNYKEYDLAISYSYKYILPAKVIENFYGNIVNMHISYLPWNRGANPNQWSILEGTPKGVTIHYINAELDKGDIIAQKIINIDSENDTLASSYNKLNEAIKSLFKEIYPLYPYWQDMKKKALGKGSYHSNKDFQKYRSIISKWDMSISEFLEKANEVR